MQVAKGKLHCLQSDESHSRPTFTWKTFLSQVHRFSTRKAIGILQVNQLMCTHRTVCVRPCVCVCVCHFSMSHFHDAISKWLWRCSALSVNVIATFHVCRFLFFCFSLKLPTTTVKLFIVTFHIRTQCWAKLQTELQLRKFASAHKKIRDLTQMGRHIEQSAPCFFVSSKIIKQPSTCSTVTWLNRNCWNMTNPQCRAQRGILQRYSLKITATAVPASLQQILDRLSQLITWNNLFFLLILKTIPCFKGSASHRTWI